ncbi:MAG: glycosyltransferase, partial [Bacteroidota bacterium]
MKIALCTIGSTGDIQPFLALAVRLREAGHYVRVVSHPFHAKRFVDRGFDYVGCGPVVTQQDLNEMLDKMLQYRNPVKQLRLLMEEAFFAEGEKYYREAYAGLEGMELVVSHHVDFLGQKAAIQRGIPIVGVVLAAAGIVTNYAPPTRAPDLGWFNRLHWLGFKAVLGTVDKRAMRFLRSIDGHSQEIHQFHSLGQDLNLIAASPLLSPTYPDLPKHFRVTGPWILPEPEFEPSPELQAFLKRHPKPVVVSFGSMGGTRGPELTERIMEALKIT